MNLTEAAEITVTREREVLEATRQRALKDSRAVRALDDGPKGGIPDGMAYIQSYHKIRAAVGFAGWSLPFILVVGGWIAERKWDTQTSLSAYYHTSMGDFFITVLVVVGVLLMAYKLSDNAPDNRIGTWAGVAAFGVAFFPTARDLDKQPNADLSAIQSLFHESGAQAVHFVCAIALISLLARICIFFSEEELAKKRKGHESANQKVSSAKWSHVHRLMAYLIAGALAFVAIFLILTWAHNETSFDIGKGNSVVEFLKKYCILFGEAVAIIAFGASWFIKGLDREILRVSIPKASE